MSVSYTSILWNKQKKVYDYGILIFVIGFIILFFGINLVLNPEITFETLLIRATGILAFLLLHIILVIGPLSRINSKFLIVLYNRRHLGVTMFIIAAVHGIFNILNFHSLSNTYALRSVFVSNTEYTSLANFPFQVLGFFALMIFAIMATTSHDFWLKNLGIKVWKALHMLVYFAYALIILHVALGALQDEKSLLLIAALFIGLIIVVGLHITAAVKEIYADKELENGDWVAVCSPDDIKDNRAKIVTVSGERAAIFKYDGKLSAVNNVCRHQGGPIGEGKIVDGCITCPWHGYQYLPGNGQSPPPFTEKVETYNLKLEDGRVWINIKPNEPGTAVEPLNIS